MRARLQTFLDSRGGRTLFLGAIFLNAILIGAQTYPNLANRGGPLLERFDLFFVYFFTAELFLRLYAAGSARAYLRDAWNVFDLLVVAACYLPAAGTYVSVARIVRVLRVVRAMSVLKSLRRLIEALLYSIPSMGHVVLLLAILLYAYAVIGTHLFGQGVAEHFGSLHRSTLTLFQIVTLEGWNEIMAAAMRVSPHAWIYFVTFIFLGTFVTFNLFVGVIVNNLEAARHEERDVEQQILDELRALRQLLSERGPTG